MVAACSGGGSDAGEAASGETADADSSSVSSDSSSTTTAPPTTVPAGPAVPEDAPPIVNTGDDFEAMYRSFNEFIELARECTPTPTSST